MKVQALIALKATFPLPVLLPVAGLARSTFLYHQARLQARLQARINKRSSKPRSRETTAGTGTAASTPKLVRHGWTVAKKTVLKLMRSLQLVCRVRRKKRYNSCQGEQGEQGKAAPTY